MKRRATVAISVLSVVKQGWDDGEDATHKDTIATYSYTETPSVEAWMSWRDEHFSLEMDKWVHYIKKIMFMIHGLANKLQLIL